MNFLLRKFLLLIAFAHLAHKALTLKSPSYTSVEIELAKLFDVDFCLWIAGTTPGVELPETHISIMNTIKGIEDF